MHIYKLNNAQFPEACYLELAAVDVGVDDCGLNQLWSCDQCLHAIGGSQLFHKAVYFHAELKSSQLDSKT